MRRVLVKNESEKFKYLIHYFTLFYGEHTSKHLAANRNYTRQDVRVFCHSEIVIVVKVL